MDRFLLFAAGATPLLLEYFMSLLTQELVLLGNIIMLMDGFLGVLVR